MKPRTTRERRAFGRRRTIIHAWLLATDRRRIPCIVRNLSAQGALVEFAVTQPLPFRLKLLFADSGIVVDCELRHRGEHGVGLLFREPVDIPALGRRRKAVTRRD